jgi:hypothetical protein
MTVHVCVASPDADVEVARARGSEVDLRISLVAILVHDDVAWIRAFGCVCTRDHGLLALRRHAVLEVGVRLLDTSLTFLPAKAHHADRTHLQVSEIGLLGGAGVGLGARTALGHVLGPLLLDCLDEIARLAHLASALPTHSYWP